MGNNYILSLLRNFDTIVKYRRTAITLRAKPPALCNFRIFQLALLNFNFKFSFNSPAPQNSVRGGYLRRAGFQPAFLTFLFFVCV